MCLAGEDAMSGPKVVRIVTRDEIIALCDGLLARLNAAVEEWIRIGQRNETLTEAEISATRARQESLRGLLAKDRFVELQKQVPAEIEFLRSDGELRLSRAAEEKAKARTGQRQTAAVAASVLVALERKGATVPVELRRALEDAAAGRSVGAAAISQAFALLSEKKDTAISDRQRQLADAHKGSEKRQTFDEWLASQAAGGDDDWTRLNLRIAELGLISGQSVTAEFDQRLRLILADQTSRRSLLIDSLELDIAHAIEEAKKRSALQLRLRALAAELSQLGSERSEVVVASIREQIDGQSHVLVALAEQATALLDQIRGEAAAKSRRHAILKGLTELGYQVNEGMETAWVRDGKVVVKKPSQPDYGVELGGSGDAGRVQMRTVAIRDAGTPVDAARDRDAETIFCGEVAQLQEQFSHAGGEIIIERALPAGATPLRVVADASNIDDDYILRSAPSSAKEL
jgi:hypothetical protein